MSRTLEQIFTDNPITTNLSADLMYFARSPYTPGNDAGMTFADFSAQFGAPFTPSELTKTDDTNVTLALGGTPATSLLQSVSLTLGWTGQLSPARGGTGVNNGSSTLTLGGNLTTSGAFASTFTMTGITTVTFPTSGTLATTSQIPSVTPSAMSKVDDTNVTLTLGGTPATSLLQAVSLTLGWTGTLSGTRGGTGVNNGASTITLGGSLTTVGAFDSIFTMTGVTGVTFPTSGTLATTAQIPTGAALTKTDDTNVTLTLGGSPTTALVNAASLTLGWTGQLGLTRGGTAASLTASNGGIVYSTASALAILSGTATAGQMLQSGSSSAPTWSTTTYPSTNAINTIMFASSANVLGSIAAANSSVLVTSAGGVPSLSTTLPANLTIPTPIIARINDVNGNEELTFTATASAVNYINIRNSATLNNPSINFVGDDANVGGIIATTGTGQLNINSANTTTPVLINSGTALQHSTALIFANTAATRNVTFPDATGTLLMTGQAINTVPSIAFSSTSGVIGTTTNDNAAAGSVGELIESTVLAASSVALTSGGTSNITNITLTAGDWDVWGLVATNPAAGTTQTRVIASISTTSATLPTAPNGGAYNAVSTAAVATTSNILPSGNTRMSVSGSTTVYLVANVTFAVSTLGAYGYLGARRRR